MIAELVHGHDDEPPYAQVVERGSRWLLQGVTCVVGGKRVDEPLSSFHPSRRAAQMAALDLMRENRAALQALPEAERRLSRG